MNIDTILSEVALGRPLSSEELLRMMADETHDEAIIATADKLNCEVNGDTVTFVHNRNINYTNICQNHCLFCGYRRNSTDADSFVLSVDDMLQKIAATPGITEVCIQGGIMPGLKFSRILEMLRAIRDTYPEIHVHAFSPMEVKYFTGISDSAVKSVITQMMANGLGSMPGTAAEILDDSVRRAVCPEKLSTNEWIEIVTTAHRLGLPSTATILVGHIETTAQTVRHMEIVRQIQAQTGGFTEFIPLVFMPYDTALGKGFGISEVLPFRKIIKYYALSRLYFYGAIKNIQSSWPKLGLANAIRCLAAGVNDLGGTLYEENITRSAGGNFGQKVTIEEFRENIIRAGRVPRQRDTLYHLLPDYVAASRNKSA